MVHAGRTTNLWPAGREPRHPDYGQMQLSIVYTQHAAVMPIYILPPTNGSPVYNRIPVLRAERGLSRQELADALGVNYQTIGYLERGDYSPSLELALRLCEYFELPVEGVFSLRPLRPLSETVFAQSRSEGAGSVRHRKLPGK